MPDSANIARHLPLMAERLPHHPAVKLPRGRTSAGDIDYLTLSFRDLGAEVAAWMDRLSRSGVKADDRVLLLVPQGLPLIASAFALFGLGAVPVVIDPGMGWRNFLRCVERTAPSTLVAIPMARWLSRVMRAPFRSVRSRVAASANPLSRLAPAGDARPMSVAARASDALAAILFTSGSTGPAKGVCYDHGMFEAQVAMIRETYAIAPGEVDLPMLPIFALFNPALGMTTVVPEIDPRRPASADPAKIVQAVRQESVTNSFGSPTLWGKVARHCTENNITLPSLRRVLCAGAPVPRALWMAAPQFLPHGQLHSPYGATEALPVSTIASSEVDPDTVRGACVGQPIRGVKVRVIPIVERPIVDIADTSELSVGEIGEIVVRGPNVTHRYDAASDATASAKIGQRAAGTAVVWHRMGDCGYRDAEGRIWFCGRKVERVRTQNETLYTEPCEQVFRSVHFVKRCALIGLGQPGSQSPALVVEREPVRSRPPVSDRELALLLRAAGQQHAHTAGIRTFFFRRRLPVDVRHNAKIHRLALARWAAGAKPIELP